MSDASSLCAVLAETGAALDDDVVEFNELDGVAGDGDLGVTVRASIAAMQGVLDATEPNTDSAALLRAVGIAIAKSAASTGGTLVATGFMRAGAALADPAVTSQSQFAAAFAAAAEGIQQRGKAQLGEKTMLDVLIPVANMFAEQPVSMDPAARFRAAAILAAAQVEAGRALVPKRGRASWLADRAAGHPDAGSRLIQRALEHAADALEARS